MDYNVIVPELPEAEVNWKYGLEEHEHNIEICPKTARPVSVIEDRSWSKYAKEVFGFSGNKQLFKGCKYMEEFILKYKRQPNEAELALFYYNRYIGSGKKATLPFETGKWVKQLLEAYSPLFKEGNNIDDLIATLK